MIRKKGLTLEWVTHLTGHNSGDWFAPRDKGECVAGQPGDFAGRTNKKYLFTPIIQPYFNILEGPSGEQAKIAYGLVQPTAQAAGHHQAMKTPFEGIIQGKLQIGLILIDWIT